MTALTRQRLDIRPYQRQDGTPGEAHDVWADDLVSLSSRAEAGETASSPGTVTTSWLSVADGPPEPGVEDEHELPF